MKKLLTIVEIIVAIVVLAGCSKNYDDILEKQNNQAEVHIINKEVTWEIPENNWVELDQINTYEELRERLEYELGIVRFGVSSKNGEIYIDDNGNWCGNNTLKNAFMNKKFIEDFWDSIRTIENISEIFGNSMGYEKAKYTIINDYWNIIPTNEDSCGIDRELTRKEVMSAINRANCQVEFREVDDEFDKLSSNKNINYSAYGEIDNTYLRFSNNELNSDTYNSLCTIGEAVYEIVNKYWKDEIKNKEYDNVYGYKTIDIIKEAGLGEYKQREYEMSYAVKNEVCPALMNRALGIASVNGIIDEGTAWYESVTGEQLLKILTKTFEALSNKGYAVNKKFGDNVQCVAIEEDIIEDTKDTDTEENILKYISEIDMTTEEIEDTLKKESGYTYIDIDKWMEVAYCYWLNIRTGPSTDYEILGSVPVGTKCHIIGICNETGWFRIIADRKIVYQCGVYFKPIDEDK
jgi:hypothetical protein